MEYAEIVTRIQKSLDSSIESRFKAGALVQQAVDQAEKRQKTSALTRLASDVGVSRSTLDVYRKTYQIWEKDRIASFRTWSSYARLSYCPSKDCDVATAKARLLAGEPEETVFSDLRNQCKRAQEVREKEFYENHGRVRGMPETLTESKAFARTVTLHIDVVIKNLEHLDILDEDDLASVRQRAEALVENLRSLGLVSVPKRLRDRLFAA